MTELIIGLLAALLNLGLPAGQIAPDSSIADTDTTHNEGEGPISVYELEVYF